MVMLILRQHAAIGKTIRKPPIDPKLNAAHDQPLRPTQPRRGVVEGVFGPGKRIYSLRLLIARLATGADTSVSMGLQLMCAEKIRRLLLLSFVFFCAWFCAWKVATSSRMALAHIWRLVTRKQPVTA